MSRLLLVKSCRPAFLLHGCLRPLGTTDETLQSLSRLAALGKVSIPG